MDWCPDEGDDDEGERVMLKTINEVVREFPAAWPSSQSLYASIREGVLPAGVVVRVGRKVLINREKLLSYFDQGGAALPGGWKREAE